jgi:D-alanyl-D-alanine-carboxypeptidase/D-alanyl-D-alanine-endopeptidase
MALDRRIARRMSGWLALAATLAACHPAAPGRAAGDRGAAIGRGAAYDAPIDVALEQLEVDTEALGAVVTVVRGDAVAVSGYGRMSPTSPATPDGRTLVRLQSISKLFDCDLLSAMVFDGRVRLGDTLAQHAPPGWSAPPPKPGDAPITLLELATHTAGLPREAKIRAGVPAAQALPQRWTWLNAPDAVLLPAGRIAAYSNIGFDLLGDALSTVAGTPYATALAATVTAPLGMTDTTVSPTPAQCARMLSPDPIRKPYPCKDQTWEAASGGLYSTADDIGRWLKYQLSPGADADRRRISQAVYIQRGSLKGAVGLDHAGPAHGLGLAWIELAPTAAHPRVLEKTGGGDGFLTYVVIDPAHRTGVFVAFDNLSGRRLPIVAADANALIGRLGDAADDAAAPAAVPAAATNAPR